MSGRRLLPVLCAALLWGCAAPPAGTPAARAAAAEQRRLALVLQGTPAIVAARPDGSVRIGVPIAASFDGGRASVKPALARVLDRLAADQRDDRTLLRITAPTDAGSRRLALGTDRAVNARAYLEERGVAPQRFSISSIARGQQLEISLTKD
ncbi:MAG TPA: hypothetical protein VNU71_00720 [Burkholderiaceae bacterium]|nr:hypothetical protein [Burkholderiaceae bacterium]